MFFFLTMENPFDLAQDDLSRGANMVTAAVTELDSLTKDTLTMNPDGEEHPWPRNVAEDYVGRLWSKFLLSFKNSWYIFGSS